MEHLTNSIGKEKTADEMFEELGYKYNEFIYEIYYTKEEEGKTISFWTDRTMVESRKGVISMKNTMQELQAINKKCKELGWI